MGLSPPIHLVMRDASSSLCIRAVQHHIISPTFQSQALNPNPASPAGRREAHLPDDQRVAGDSTGNSLGNQRLQNSPVRG